MPRGKKKGAALSYVRRMFATPVFGEEAAVQLFNRDTLAFADMLVAAAKEGGLLEEIVLHNLPLGFLPGEEFDTQEGGERLWQWLVFMTLRYHLKPLPGMPVCQPEAGEQDNLPETTGQGRRRRGRSEETIRARVIAFLGGPERALAKYEELRQEKTIAQVRAYLNEKGVIPVTRANLIYIIKKLQKAGKPGTKKQRTPSAAAKETGKKRRHGEKSIRAQVIKALGGEKNAVARYGELKKRYRTCADVVEEYFQRNKGIAVGAKTLSVIISNLRTGK